MESSLQSPCGHWPHASSAALALSMMAVGCGKPWFVSVSIADIHVGIASVSARS